MSPVQEQALQYAKIFTIQAYSIFTTFIYHLTSITANLIDKYPQISTLLIGVTSIIVAIYLIKNLFVFALKSIIKLIKLLVFVSIITILIIIYFRKLEFFTVDLVNFYNLIVKDVSKGTVYSNEIVNNLENIYKETLQNGELLEHENKYLQYVVSKSDYYKKLISLFN